MDSIVLDTFPQQLIRRIADQMGQYYNIPRPGLIRAAIYRAVPFLSPDEIIDILLDSSLITSLLGGGVETDLLMTETLDTLDPNILGLTKAELDGPRFYWRRRFDANFR